MITCPACGRENPDGSRFCMACGRLIAQGVLPFAESSPEAPAGAAAEVDARGFEVAAPAWNYAGFGVRAAAYLLDQFFVSLLLLALFLLIGFGFELGLDREAGGALGALGVVVVGLGYYVYYFGSSGQTWGKRLLGLRVIRLDGSRLGYGRALGRALGYYLSGLLLGGGFLMVAFSRRSQGLHDKLVGSYVVRVR